MKVQPFSAKLNNGFYSKTLFTNYELLFTEYKKSIKLRDIVFYSISDVKWEALFLWSII